ncbi:hypothetical protein PR048_010904 [Dryococelus australis]|uniref:Uncharacterized protein n=1 Tax=Dryococelus australis TaxID=614101 RepID=A0ABQ9I405_9NEOP|nr:hypothetical protein PR048_010904 [Dryococelus australis]
MEGKFVLRRSWCSATNRAQVSVLSMSDTILAMTVARDGWGKTVLFHIAPVTAGSGLIAEEGVCHRVCWSTFSQVGKLMSETTFNQVGKPMSETTFNQVGKPMSETTFNQVGKPMSETTFNQVGKPMSETTFNQVGKPMPETTFNQVGKPMSETTFNQVGKPMSETTFNQVGKPMSETTFNQVGKPMSETTFNQVGKPMSETTFNQVGKPMSKTTFNQVGKPMSETTFNQVGKPMPETTCERTRGVDTDKCGEFLNLCEYLDSNNDCQHRLTYFDSNLVEFSDDGIAYCEKKLENNLEEHFGKICLYHLHRDKKKERKSIIDAAVMITNEDICSKIYECDSYPTCEEIEDGGKHNPTKTLSVAHTIISAADISISIVSKRSSLSSHTVLELIPHSTFGINMGFPASYSELLKYESAITQHTPVVIDEKAFIQFVFENADHNVLTIDGKGTFHVMGGVKCVKPKSCVDARVQVPRPKLLLKYSKLGKFGVMQIKMYEKKYKAGVSVMFFGWPYYVVKCNHMSGGMETAMGCNNFFETPCILLVPIVSQDPSNPSTILTCLEYATIAKCISDRAALSFEFHEASLHLILGKHGGVAYSTAVISVKKVPPQRRKFQDRGTRQACIHEHSLMSGQKLPTANIVYLCKERTWNIAGWQ